MAAERERARHLDTWQYMDMEEVDETKTRELALRLARSKVCETPLTIARQPKRRWYSALFTLTVSVECGSPSLGLAA
jgi:hypothetical protein